jgi:WD40 repeat protein
MFKFKPVVLCFILSIAIFTCGNSTIPQKSETLEPVDVFIQAVGLDIRRVAFSSDDSHIITSGSQGTTIWDLNAKKELKTLFKTEAHSMAVSKSGRYSITYTPVDQGKIHICDFSTSTIRPLQIISKENASAGGRYMTGFSITDDEKRFALETDNKIKVYDIETLKLVNEMALKESHHLFNYRKKGLSLIPGTNDLLSISYDISLSEPDVLEEERESRFLINIWDLNNQKPKFSSSLKSKFIYSWAISGSGKKCALLFMDKQILIIDLITGEKSNHTIESDNEISVVGFTDETHLTFAGREGITGIYDLEEKQTTLIETDVKRLFEASYSVDLAISNDGNRVAFCNGYHTLIVYDIPSKDVTILGDPANNVLGLYYDADGSLNILTPDKAYQQKGAHFDAQELKIKKLVSIFADQLRIENTKTGLTDIFDALMAKTVYSVKSEDKDRSYAAFTQDGKYAFYWDKTENPNNQLSVIHLEDIHSKPVRLENSNSYGHNIKVFDDHKKAIISGPAHENLGIWDMKTGKLLRKLDEQSGNSEAFECMDDHKCLIGARGNVKLYDLPHGNVLQTFTPDGYYGDNRDIEKIAFSKGKKYFATGDAWGLVTLWDVNKKHEVLSFENHKAGVTSLAFSPDDQTIVSGSYNGKSAVIREVSTGRELARFVSFADGEWIVITPEGYFNASPGGARHLNVRVGKNVYAIDNFYEKFFNPVFVASVLQGKKVEVLSDIRKGVLAPPDVRITSPSRGQAFSTDTLTVTVAAQDRGGGIDEIRLYHNGKAIGEDTRAVKIVPHGSEAIREYRVSLVDGINTFRAVGFSKDRTESNPYELLVKLTAPSKDVSLYVLAVGINRYKNPALNLNYAEPDARGIADFFKGQGKGKDKGLFKNVDIQTIYNEQATKENIISQLNRLQNIHLQDAVLIFLAGHGESFHDKWYFIPHELTYPEREEDVRIKGISSDELSGYMKNIKAQKILMLIDACKSGAVLIAFRGFEDRKALSQLSRSTGVHIVAASTKDQFAAEVKELGHGVFTYTLLEGLGGKATGNNDTVTVRKLMSYVEEKLPEITKKYKQEAQYPVVDSRGMDFPLVILK